MTTIAILGALLGLLALRIPVAFALGGLGMILLMIGGFSHLMVPAGLHASTQSFVLLSVPMFLMMSNILLKGGIGKDLFAAMQAWVGHWPGGLAIATISELRAVRGDLRLLRRVRGDHRHRRDAGDDQARLPEALRLRPRSRRAARSAS